MIATRTVVFVTLVLSAGLTACSEAPPEPLGLEPQMSHAAIGPDFGAKASGSELWTPGIVTDGGVGVESASITEPNFTASAQFVPSATYLPELKAFSTNTTAANSDDITQSRAEAYQVFTSSVAQTITLDVQLSGSVVDDATDVSFVLADVFVYGGAGFEVIESPICEDGRLGQFTFDGTYLCGTRLARANLFIPVGDVTLTDPLTFNVAAGATFGVYAVLRANSSGGSADASQTLVLSFTDDQFISAVAFPTDPPDLSVAIDVKPGSDPDCINLESQGSIPVAIFGSDVFAVADVDRATLVLSGLDVRLRPSGEPMCALDDVDGDGYPDLVCHFATDAARWTGEGGVATLSGALLDGTAIAGEDSVCLVPREG